jgi:hypothetical protein
MAFLNDSISRHLNILTLLLLSVSSSLAQTGNHSLSDFVDAATRHLPILLQFPAGGLVYRQQEIQLADYYPGLDYWGKGAY